MIICVQTFVCNKAPIEDEFESEFFINDERVEGRQRLAKHAWWAMRNSRSVTTFAKGV